MSEKVEHIGKLDVLWSYAATILMIGAGVILLPFILHKLPTETIGIWNIFQVVTSLVALLDFGFQPSFSRNISYIFSGAKELKKNGICNVEKGTDVNYELLANTIYAMKTFYKRMALIVLLFLATLGTGYMVWIIQDYHGSHYEAIIAWIILVTINCLNLYTFYYDALLTGKGKVKRIQQINIIGQLSYIVIAIALIYAGAGLVAIVLSQLISICIKRILAYHSFFTATVKEHLASVNPNTQENNLIRTISPNAIKLGLTSIAGFMVYKSAVLIGSACFPLEIMASYGITFQLVDILARCGTVYYQAYTPKISQYQLQANKDALRGIYKNSIIMLVLVFILGGATIVLLGNWALGLVNSQTYLLSSGLTIALILIHLLERNHVIAWGFILAKNEVPFMWPSIISALLTIILMLVFIKLDMGIWALIVAPGIAQLAYQNWKWPVTTIKDLYFSGKD